MTGHEVRVRHQTRWGSEVPFARPWIVECLSCDGLYLRVGSEVEADAAAARHLADPGGDA